MTIYSPELLNVNTLRNMPLSINHPYGKIPDFGNVLEQGRIINELGGKTGGETVLRSGVFEDAMLNALDKVSAQQQKASNMIQDAITNPDLYDAHDITIAQAQASLALNTTVNILSRLVQSWRDLINIR